MDISSSNTIWKITCSKVAVEICYNFFILIYRKKALLKILHNPRERTWTWRLNYKGTVRKSKKEWNGDEITHPIIPPCDGSWRTARVLLFPTHYQCTGTQHCVLKTGSSNCPFFSAMLGFCQGFTFSGKPWFCRCLLHSPIFVNCPVYSPR